MSFFYDSVFSLQYSPRLHVSSPLSTRSFCENIFFLHLKALRGSELRLVRTVGMVGLNNWRDPLSNFEQKMSLALRPPSQVSCSPSSTPVVLKSFCTLTPNKSIQLSGEPMVSSPRGLYYQFNNCRTATHALQYCLWRNKQNSFHNVITTDDSIKNYSNRMYFETTVAEIWSALIILFDLLINAVRIPCPVDNNFELEASLFQ